MDKLTPFKNIVIRLAAVYDYGEKLNDVNLKIMAQLLADQSESLEEAELAEKLYIQKAESSFFPIPIHKILHSIRPPVKEIDHAKVIASRIWDAIATFGYDRAKDAREYIGEEGWETVRADGGWSGICESSGLGDKGIIKAQLRELAESLARRKKAGLGDIRDHKTEVIKAPDEIKKIADNALTRIGIPKITPDGDLTRE